MYLVCERLGELFCKAWNCVEQYCSVILGSNAHLSRQYGLRYVPSNIRIRYRKRMAALFYSPVDFTDASNLHQTVVKFIGWSIESDKIALLKIKFSQENCQQKDTPLILKQMLRRMIDSPRCCFIPFIGWKFDASIHTSVWCIGEINRWIKQRSHSKRSAWDWFLCLWHAGAVSKQRINLHHLIGQWYC